MTTTTLDSAREWCRITGMPDPLPPIIAGFHDYDRNADGDPAIVQLSYVSVEDELPVVPTDARIALVLVESRLLQSLQSPEGKEVGDLRPCLQQLKSDLAAEGLSSRFISAEVYRGARDQDGRTLMAMRDFQIG